MENKNQGRDIDPAFFHALNFAYEKTPVSRCRGIIGAKQKKGGENTDRYKEEMLRAYNSLLQCAEHRIALIARGLLHYKQSGYVNMDDMKDTNRKLTGFPDTLKNSDEDCEPLPID